MKILSRMGLLSGLCLLCGGCFATPGYSPGERNAMIARTWDYDFKQAVEDVDHQVFMSYPPSRETIWNVR